MLTRVAGIHAIEAYAPRHCTSASALESLDGKAFGNAQSLLLDRYSTCGEDEDITSMAITAMERLMHRCGVHAEEVGMLQASSSSVLDRSKSVKSELMSLLATRHADGEGVDHYGADAGMAAVIGCIRWAHGESWDGRWALAACSDVALTPPGRLKSAAAVTLLVGQTAPLHVVSEYVGRFSSLSEPQDSIRQHGTIAMMEELITCGTGAAVAFTNIAVLLSSRGTMQMTIRMSTASRAPMEGSGQHTLRVAGEVDVNPKLKSQLEVRTQLTAHTFAAICAQHSACCGKLGWMAQPILLHPGGSSAYNLQEVPIPTLDGSAGRAYMHSGLATIKYMPQFAAIAPQMVAATQLFVLPEESRSGIDSLAHIARSSSILGPTAPAGAQLKVSEVLRQQLRR
jgi:hypothetical protein